VLPQVEEELPALRVRITEEQKRNADCLAARTLIQMGKAPQGPRLSLRAQQMAEGTEIVNGALVSKWKDPRSEILHVRLVVPLALRHVVLQEMHEAPTCGHSGV